MLYAIRLPLRNGFTEQQKKLRSTQGKTKRLHREPILQLLEETAGVFPKKAEKEILFSLAKIETPQGKRLTPDRDPFEQKPRATKTLLWLQRSPNTPTHTHQGCSEKLQQSGPSPQDPLAPPARPLGTTNTRRCLSSARPAVSNAEALRR